MELGGVIIKKNCVKSLQKVIVSWVKHVLFIWFESMKTMTPAVLLIVVKTAQLPKLWENKFNLFCLGGLERERELIKLSKNKIK